MNARKRLITLIAAVVLYALLLGAQEKSGPYEYPVKPGTQEWKALTSHEQKRQACQIPQQILSSMSTPDLLETCLNYPLYGDMIAYDSVQEGFNYVKNGFNGLQEFLKRNDATAALIDKYQKLDPAAIDSTWTSIKKGEYSIKFFFLEILLAQDEVITNLTKNDRLQLLQESYKKFLNKKQHPEVYGQMGFANNALLIGRIMLKANYAPFVRLVLQDSKLNEILKNAWPISKEYMNEIVNRAEDYIKQR